MFERIDLLHFKCFERLHLPLQPLTLLSGLNASGKSSVIQAFGLFHQTMREHQWSSALMLNGSAVRLGTAGDVIDQVSGGRNCGIGLRSRDDEYQWNFVADRSSMSMEVEMVTLHGESYLERDGDIHMLDQLLPYYEKDSITKREDTKGDTDLKLNLDELSYLTAERMGPRENYPLEGPEYFAGIGTKGERAASLIYFRGEKEVLPNLVLPNVPETRQRQVEARMATFFPAFELEVTPIPRTNSITLGVRTSHQTDFHRPVHTGFGITQVFPIVVAALFAEPNGLLLVENPEVHLHPAGQATMGEFLALVASAGVQVILETHSDHILNGVRKAVKKGVLPAEHAALHFFRPREYADTHGGSQVQSPLLADDGSVDHWPNGFFDQFDNDMNYFADWS